MKYTTLNADEVNTIKDEVKRTGPRDETIAALEREHAQVQARLDQDQSPNPDQDQARLAEIEEYVKTAKSSTTKK